MNPIRRANILVVARWIFGVLYAGTGLVITSGFLGLAAPPPQPTPAAAAFTHALTQSGIVDPLLTLTYLVGGIALLRDKTAPIGIILLAPAVAVIFLFHLALSGQWIWGTLNLVWLLALAWQYRSAFRPLWNHAQPPR